MMKSKKEIVSNCGMCQFFYQIREADGLGVCFQKLELKQALEIFKGTCRPMLTQFHRCNSCKHDYPTCDGEPKFLWKHPIIDGHYEWIIKRHRDIIYDCNRYDMKEFEKRDTITNRMMMN